MPESLVTHVSINYSVKSMHDWTLRSIHVDWASGMVKIEVEDSASLIRVVEVKDLLSIAIPKKSPWGKSVSVNEVTYGINEMTKKHLMIIEMQSGDLIKVEAGFISKVLHEK